ncbi:MAG: hypothetical protein ACERKO_10245 [Acetanaerobacterium sp.]
MKLLFLVLNKVELLDPILEQLAGEGITGATVLSSKGMARVLADYNELSFLGSLRTVVSPDRQENKTMFMVLSDGKVDTAVHAIEKIVDLSQPDSGILFTVPVDFQKGATL